MPSKKKNPHSGPMPPPDPDLPDPVPDNTQRKRYYNNGEHIYYVTVGGEHSILRVPPVRAEG